MSDRKREKAGATARQKLLDAALSLIRIRGYEATTVDDMCAAAGVTKGAFFHHFDSKESLAVAAAEYWSETTAEFFATAPYHRHSDPLQRVLGYIDFRKAILTGKVPEFTCLVGTMVQEVYVSSPAIRDACDVSISGHATTLEPDIAEAMVRYHVRADCTAAQPSAAYPGRSARRVRAGESERQRRHRRQLDRPSSPLCGAAFRRRSRRGE